MAKIVVSLEFTSQALAVDLENPFVIRVHGVSLNAISPTIKIDLNRRLENLTYPNPKNANDGVRW